MFNHQIKKRRRKREEKANRGLVFDNNDPEETGFRSCRENQHVHGHYLWHSILY
jgi:hypothetical protein